MATAKITEIFSSIQGEGLYVGVPQSFVRFSGCNLDCIFCDEKKKKACRDFSSEQLIRALTRPKLRFVSLTGGEPLCQIDFLKGFLPKLKKRNFLIYLETNGTLPGNLKEIIDWIDIISMDIKLPSSTKMGVFWNEHSEFLKLSKKRESFVKVVVTNDTIESDIKKALDLIHSIDKRIPFIIQPVTANGVVKAVKPDRLIRFFELSKKTLKDVRIIPQIHKILGVR